MKSIIVERRESPFNLSSEFLVVLWGYFRFRTAIPMERILNGEMPWWYRATKWYVQTTCKHSWEKIGKSQIEGLFLSDITTYIQDVKCSKCGREAKYKYESE